MPKNINKILLVLFTIGLMLTFMTTVPAFASDDQPIEIDLATTTDGASGDGYSYSGGLLTITGEGPFIITTSSSVSGRGIVVNTASTTAAITLEDVSISNTGTSACALAISGSSVVELTLSGSSSLISGSNRAGLEVPLGTELTILGTPADSLNVTGGQCAAGIGGGYSVTPAVSGTIIIKGSVIEANGGTAPGGTGAGAGIGGGRGGSGGTITIEGGDITATGGYRAAGIGGGQGGTSGTILIKGGDITALGNGYGAGIGGGTFRPAGSITIEGGTIDATGVGGGAGIGGGYINENLSATFTGGTITISGGDITARAQAQGSGIGSGIITNITYSLPTTVTITGGVIDAASYSGAGIGSRDGTINISGGTVTATSSHNGAGIGGGYRESGGTINISGGTIIATGAASNGGAGIGSGFPYDYDYLEVLSGGTINISGGDITATGGEYSAGIGGGYGGNAGTITITAGNITATGASGGAGIGGGLVGGAGTITITGGDITAAGTESGAGIGKGHGSGDGGAIVISQAQVTASSQYDNDVISAGSGGTVYIGFTGSPGSPAYDPVITRAKVTLANGGINAATTTFGTCQITGAGAGDLAGEYIEGVKQVATYSITAINNQVFTELSAGYEADDRQILSITIENTGTGALNNLAVALSGDGADSFIVSQPVSATLAQNGDTTTFTVIPQTGLAAGTYSATVTVSADNMSDQSFTVTQSINVLPPSTICTLSELTAAGLTLTPTFNSNTTIYSASVGSSISSTVITATPSNNNATVAINDSETISKEIVLNTGSNTVTIVVTAEDGMTTNTYTIVINRASTSSSPGGGGGGSSIPVPVKEVSKIIRAASGGEISMMDVIVNVPAVSITADTRFSIKKLSTGEQNSIVPPGMRLKLGGSVYDITTTGSRYFGANPLTIKIAYEPANMAKNELPVIHYYDDVVGEWVALKTTTEYDAKSGRHFAVTTVNHLTKFAVFGTEVEVDIPKIITLIIGDSAATVAGQPYNLDALPYLDEQANRTLVPVRFVSEALGAWVEWESANRTVTIEDSGKTIVLTLGSPSVLVDGAEQAIDCAPATLAPGRTFVPLRFISETLGAQVEYDAPTKQITITR